MRPARLLFAALALSLASAPAAAKTEVGVITGFNFGTLSIDGVSEMDPRGAFALGGVADVGISDRFGIRIEPMFMSKGGKSTERNVYWGMNNGAVFQLDCIDVPILARFDLGEPDDARAYLLGGVGVSFFTETKVEISQDNYEETVDFGDIVNPVDVSIDLGAGFSTPVGDNRLTLDGRVAFGLTDINKGGTVTYNGSPLVVPATSTKTLDFRVFATFFFPWPGQ